MDFGIMFFSSSARNTGSNPYRLLLEAAKFGDDNGFCCVWTPERHFHEFGGLFPNPAVTGAMLAAITDHIEIRAGSLISPLHDPIRIAEEWSAVDNLSEGRVGISFGSGWNINDFVFYPDRYADRHGRMYRQIEEVRTLWRGGTMTRTNSFGKEVDISIYPKPVQAELPIWVTSSGNSETFASAGRIGANLLTHLIGQDLPSLRQKIQIYREALRENGFDPKQGKVSLMLHTFMGEDTEAVKEVVRTPFREYLRSAVNLEVKAAKGGGSISGGHKITPHEIDKRDMEHLLDLTFDRYFQTGALMGTVEKCEALVADLAVIGIDEIACLIDFFDDVPAILKSLTFLARLRQKRSSEGIQRQTQAVLDDFLDDLE